MNVQAVSKSNQSNQEDRTLLNFNGLSDFQTQLLESRW